jgi:hypothetical protein
MAKKKEPKPRTAEGLGDSRAENGRTGMLDKVIKPAKSERDDPKS